MNYFIMYWGVDFMIHLGRLKALREDRDLSQTQIAKILDISQVTYSQYERGVRELHIDQLKTLCEFYNVSADYILGFTNIPN